MRCVILCAPMIYRTLALFFGMTLAANSSSYAMGTKRLQPNSNKNTASTPAPQQAPANSTLVLRYADEHPQDYALSFRPSVQTNHAGTMKAVITANSDSIRDVQEYVYLENMNGKILRKVKIPYGGFATAFTPDGRYLVVSLGAALVADESASTLRTLDVQSGEWVDQFCWDKGLDKDIQAQVGINLSMGFSSDGTKLYRGSGNKVIVEDPVTCKPIQTVTTSYEVLEIDVSDNNLRVLTNSDDEGGGFRLYDIESMKSCGLSGSISERIADCNSRVAGKDGRTLNLVLAFSVDADGYRAKIWQDSTTGNLWTGEFKQKTTYDALGRASTWEDTSYSEAQNDCAVISNSLNGIAQNSFQLPTAAQWKDIGRGFADYFVGETGIDMDDYWSSSLVKDLSDQSGTGPDYIALINKSYSGDGGLVVHETSNVQKGARTVCIADATK